MRSFESILLDTFTSGYTITLIDEPEAFLHPSQARLLGKMLANNNPSKRQLFISTHSEDFLQGTSLEGVEQLMIQVPNFEPKRNGCTTCGDLPFDPKLSIYEMEYKDLMKYCFGKIENNLLINRLKLLTSNFNGEIFLNTGHKERFYHVIYKHNYMLDTNRHIGI